MKTRSLVYKLLQGRGRCIKSNFTEGLDNGIQYNQCLITNLTHISLSCIFISILYMFRAAMCASSGELIVSIRHLVYVTLYRCPFGVQVALYTE